MNTWITSSALNGNILLWIIGGCSVISFAVFIERFFYLKRSGVNVKQLMIDVRRLLKEEEVMESIHFCERIGGPIANVLISGLVKREGSKAERERAMEMSGVVAIAQLEKNTRALSIIAHISPLIGLLGTVLGFIQAFSEMQRSGLIDISASRIGGAMEYALVTTAAGLVVAIPSIVAYNYLVGRIRGFILQMQTAACELLELLDETDRNREKHEV